jgi:hypothetical protein
MRYAPGKVPARPLPAAPVRPAAPTSPGVKQTVTGAPAQVPVGKPAPIPSSLINTRPRPPSAPPPVQPPPAAPAKSILAGEGRSMANRMGRPAPTPAPQPGQTRPPRSILAGEGRSMANRMGRMGMKEGGKVSSASKRADGCAVKGKTKGKMV